jgi:hypothetical protein
MEPLEEPPRTTHCPPDTDELPRLIENVVVPPVGTIAKVVLTVGELEDDAPVPDPAPLPHPLRKVPPIRTIPNGRIR